MTFDGRQIAAFLSIVAHGSLGRAAEALHLTQPALSRTIKRLEARLGAPLFERHSKGMALTPVGQALLPRATLLQQEAAHAVEEINALRGLAKGTVKVGAIGSVASVVLPVAISRLIAAWPNLRVQVIEGVWDRLAEALVRHEIDLALDIAKPDSDEICAVDGCAWQDSSHVVAAPSHPLHASSRLALADTLDALWAVPPRGTAPFEHLKQTFAAEGLGLPNVVVETRSITVLKSLILRAGFLSWMPRPIWALEQQVGLIEALPIAGLQASRTLTAFRRRRGLLPAPAVKLVEALRKTAAEAP